VSARRTLRIGQIVPSSNVTMETEVPAMLRRARVGDDIDFTFHSSRAPMKRVTHEELAAMNTHMVRCARDLADARVDIVASACLVAIMAQGHGFHRQTEASLAAALREEAAPPPIVTSAGALVEALAALGARRVALIAPYTRQLTNCVVDYIEHEGIAITESVALEVPDNLAVAALDPAALVDIAARIDTRGIDALVLSACVQMPSLPVLDTVQQRCPVPVLSTAAATVFTILRRLGLPTEVPAAGALLSGRYA
jgi:maleate isomerase